MATKRIPIDLDHYITNVFSDILTLTSREGRVHAFKKDVDGKMSGSVRIPKDANATTPAAKVILTILANATSGVSSWLVSGRPITNSENWNQSLTDETTQDITMPTTAYELEEVTFTLPTSLNDYPVQPDDLLKIEIQHKGTKTEDTLAVNSLLLKAELEYDD